MLFRSLGLKIVVEHILAHCRVYICFFKSIFKFYSLQTWYKIVHRTTYRNYCIQMCFYCNNKRQREKRRGGGSLFSRIPRGKRSILTSFRKIIDKEGCSWGGKCLELSRVKLLLDSPSYRAIFGAILYFLQFFAKYCLITQCDSKQQYPPTSFFALPRKS